MWRSEDFTVWVLGIELRSTGLFPLGPLTSLSFIYLVLEKEKEDEDDDKDYSSQTWLLEIIGAEEVCW